MENSEENILEKEKQNVSWNKFIYNFCLSKIEIVKKSEFNDEAFGSWLIEFGNKRIVYDGKDSVLILQNRNLGNWKDEMEISKENLTEKKVMEILK